MFQGPQVIAPIAVGNFYQKNPGVEIDGLCSGSHLGPADDRPCQHRGFFRGLSAQEVAHDAVQTGAYRFHAHDYNVNHDPNL